MIALNLILLTLLNFAIAEMHFLPTINSISVGSLDNDYVTDVKVWMRKVDRKRSAPCAKFKLLQELNKILTQVEVYRHSGTTRVRMPFNIVGDGCDYLKQDFLFVPAIKKALNVTECPIPPGEFELRDLLIKRKQLPKILMNGIFDIVIKFSTAPKKLLVVITIEAEIISVEDPPKDDTLWG